MVPRSRVFVREAVVVGVAAELKCHEYPVARNPKGKTLVIEPPHKTILLLLTISPLSQSHLPNLQIFNINVIINSSSGVLKICFAFTPF